MTFAPIVPRAATFSIDMESKQTLKIGFDAKRLFHNASGLGNYSRTLVKNLKTHFPQHEYHLFTPSVVNNEETRYFLEGGFHIHTPGRWTPKSWWRTFGIGPMCKALDLDIFHGLSHELPWGMPQKGLKTVVTMHDLIYEVYPSFFKWHDRKLYRLKYKSACNRADAVIAISEATARDLINLYKIPRNKISVIFQSCAAVFQTEAPEVHLKKHFLYVGTIEERKGMIDLVHSYAQLSDAEKKPVVVIGGGTDHLDEVKKVIRYYGLENQFEFKGKLPNAKLLEYYDQAIALLLPSVYEGFGIPLAESLFRGVPVITSPFSALPEAAGPGGLIVDPKDHKALANAMRSMLNEEVWNKLSEAGGTFVKQKFSSRSTAEELHRFYLTLLEITYQKESEARL